MDLVFDIETDDVKATKVHCIVAQNPESGEIFKFPPNKLEGYQFLATADRLIGHNIIGFDIPMVHKFSDVDLSDKEVIDTLYYLDYLIQHVMVVMVLNLGDTS